MVGGIPLRLDSCCDLSALRVNTSTTYIYAIHYKWTVFSPVLPDVPSLLTPVSLQKGNCILNDLIVSWA